MDSERLRESYPRKAKAEVLKDWVPIKKTIQNYLECAAVKVKITKI